MTDLDKRIDALEKELESLRVLRIMTKTTAPEMTTSEFADGNYRLMLIIQDDSDPEVDGWSITNYEQLASSDDVDKLVGMSYRMLVYMHKALELGL